MLPKKFNIFELRYVVAFVIRLRDTTQNFVFDERKLSMSIQVLHTFQGFLDRKILWVSHGMIVNIEFSDELSSR